VSPDAGVGGAPPLILSRDAVHRQPPPPIELRDLGPTTARRRRPTSADASTTDTTTTDDLCIGKSASAEFQRAPRPAAHHRRRRRTRLLPPDCGPTTHRMVPTTDHRHISASNPNVTAVAVPPSASTSGGHQGRIDEARTQ